MEGEKPMCFLYGARETSYDVKKDGTSQNGGSIMIAPGMRQVGEH